MPPVRPNGKQLDWQDFELSFIASAPDAFAWKNESHRFLCAQAPTASTAVVIARYPGGHLRPEERIAGVEVQQTVEVAMQGLRRAAPRWVRRRRPTPDRLRPMGPARHLQRPIRPTATPSQSRLRRLPRIPSRRAIPRGRGTLNPWPRHPMPATCAPENSFSNGSPATPSARRARSPRADPQVADAAGDVLGTTLETGSDVVNGTGAVTGAASKSVQGVGNRCPSPTPSRCSWPRT